MRFGENDPLTGLRNLQVQAICLALHQPGNQWNRQLFCKVCQGEEFVESFYYGDGLGDW